MNRATGLILAFAIGTSVGACASAGTGTGGAATEAEQQQLAGTEPDDNDWTEEASRSLGIAMLQQDPAEKQTLYQAALQAAQQSIAEEPGNPKGWYLAGQAHANLGHFAAADSAFDKAEEIYPAYEPEIVPERENAWIIAYNQGIEALQADDMQHAIALMEQADLIYQGRPEARLNLGAFYANQDQPEKAIGAFRGALEILGQEHPELDSAMTAQWKGHAETALMNLGQLLLASGRSQEAEQSYRDYLAGNPDNLAVKSKLAEALVKQGKTAEANEIYGELLTRSDLGDSDYLMIGVGLFQDEDYDGAAEAFRKAAEKNPYSRDAHYNLAQALFMRASALDEARDTAKGAQAQAITAELTKANQGLATSAEAALELDPNNRNIIVYVARAYQTLSELTEGAQQADYRAKVQAALKLHEAATVEVSNLTISLGDGEVQVNGAVKNVKLEPGAPVRLRLTMLAIDGQAIGSQDVTLAAPAQEMSAPFQAAIPVTGTLAGWKYEVVN